LATPEVAEKSGAYRLLPTSHGPLLQKHSSHTVMPVLYTSDTTFKKWQTGRSNLLKPYPQLDRLLQFQNSKADCTPDHCTGPPHMQQWRWRDLLPRHAAPAFHRLAPYICLLVLRKKRRTAAREETTNRYMDDISSIFLLWQRKNSPTVSQNRVL